MGGVRYLKVNCQHMVPKLRGDSVSEPELKGTIEVNGVNGRASSTVRTLGFGCWAPFIVKVPFGTFGSPFWRG